MTKIQNCAVNQTAMCRLPNVDPCNPTAASTSMQGGKAVFENDNYRITAGDDNTVTINNKHTGETYEAWGDPHMKIDGKDSFDFWGTTTLRLEDGTKVTIQTTPWANDPSMTLSSKVTITNGDYGVQIGGIDTNCTGDLRIDEGKGWGQVLDAVVSDGNVLQENPTGKGFLAIDDSGQIRTVDQTYINQTDLQKSGANKQPDAMQELFRLFSSLLSVSYQGRFIHEMSSDEPKNEAPARVDLPASSPAVGQAQTMAPTVVSTPPVAVFGPGPAATPVAVFGPSSGPTPVPQRTLESDIAMAVLGAGPMPPNVRFNPELSRWEQVTEQLSTPSPTTELLAAVRPSVGPTRVQSNLVSALLDSILAGHPTGDTRPNTGTLPVVSDWMFNDNGGGFDDADPGPAPAPGDDPGDIGDVGEGLGNGGDAGEGPGCIGDPGMGDPGEGEGVGDGAGDGDGDGNGGSGD